MKKKLTLNIVSIATFVVFTIGTYTGLNAQAINENFDDITLLAGNGWVMTNASTPVGSIWSN